MESVRQMGYIREARLSNHVLEHDLNHQLATCSPFFESFQLHPLAFQVVGKVAKAQVGEVEYSQEQVCKPSLLGWRPSLLGWRPPLRLEAIAIRLEAIATRLEESL